MTATKEARERLKQLRELAGDDCIGFLFEGSVGTCRGSSPVLKPVSDPVENAEAFEAGEVTLFAEDEFAELLSEATFQYDGALFGRGLTVRWPHRDQGCPNCR